MSGTGDIRGANYALTYENETREVGTDYLYKMRITTSGTDFSVAKEPCFDDWGT
jgi:hypothetical protein